LGEGRPTVVTQTSGVWGTALAIALPAGGVRGTRNPAQLDSVSCPSVGNCLAVGGYPTGSGATQPMLTSETAGTWGVATSVAPPAGALTGSSAYASLEGAWCASPGNCVAVGSYTDTGFNDVLMSAVETSGSWGTATALPAVTGASPNLLFARSLTCTSAGNCTVVAVGGSGLQSYGWTETLGTWGVPTLLAPAASSFFVWGVACPSATTCIAVGQALSRAATVTETSGAWGALTQLRTPRLSPRTRMTAILTSIACQSAICEAVGTAQSAASGQLAYPIATTWSGGAWSSMGLERSVPAGTGLADNSAFTGVACPSASKCVAVGGGGLYPYHAANQPVYPYSTVLTPVRPIVAPGPPAAATADPKIHGALVTWLPPLDDGGSPVTSFTATATPGGRTCTSAGNGCRITGLINGHQYLVKVTDANSFASSKWVLSNRFFAGALPTAPSHVHVALSRGVAVVSWHRSTSPAGEPVQRYEVIAQGKGGVEHECVTKKLACTVRGLVKGHVYLLSVSAIDATGGWNGPKIRIVAR
jgi:hypothetical protein